jgi:TIR domain
MVEPRVRQLLAPGRECVDDDEEFWEDLLAHIRQRVLVPITGPELTVVRNGDTVRPLTEIIAQRLMDRYDLDIPSTRMTMGEAAAAFLRQRGREEAERLYRIVCGIIAEFEDESCEPLRELARIADLPLLVSTTPDRLLARAVNDVRFHGRPLARELTFSPSQSTREQEVNIPAPAEDETVIVRLFGRAASTPQYAVHEEDLLEWLHSLASGTGCLPEWAGFALKHQPVLFIGCDIPDWLGRFLMRLSSHTRLFLGAKQFFLVNSPQAREPLLSNFFSTYCGKAQVQQLEMDPRQFVSELHDRWEEQVRDRGGSAPVGLPSTSSSIISPPSIFISYIREDVTHARRLADEIAGLGGDVWLDERRLQPGDAWEEEILRSIRKAVRLFLPIISTSTEGCEEGYVFREWREAVVRSYSIMSRRFIIPVMVDEDSETISTYRQIPDEFKRFNFGHAPGGAPDSVLRSLLVEEIRAMRRSGAP